MSGLRLADWHVQNTRPCRIVIQPHRHYACVLHRLTRDDAAAVVVFLEIDRVERPDHESKPVLPLHESRNEHEALEVIAQRLGRLYESRFPQARAIASAQYIMSQ